MPTPGSSSTRLEALVPSRDSRARTRSPSPRAWRPDFPGAAREPRLEGKPRTPLSSRVATRVSWCLAAQTKRRAEGIRVPAPLAGRGSTTARGILRLCPASACQTGLPWISRRGLRPPEQLEREAGFPSSDKTRPDSPVPTLQGPCGRRPGAVAQSHGREAALAWASLVQRFPASSVLARAGAGCGNVGDACLDMPTPYRPILTHSL